MTIEAIKLTTKTKRVRAILERLRATADNANSSKAAEKFMQFVGEHGYTAALKGEVAEEEKENARDAIEYANTTLLAAGYNPHRMFVKEIIDALFDAEISIQKRDVARRMRAWAKLNRYQEANKISALENTNLLIGRSIIPYYRWVNPAVFKPLESDKILLRNAKYSILEAVLAATTENSDWSWRTGHDGDETLTNQEHFLEIFRLALWMDFRQTAYFFNASKLAGTGTVKCNLNQQPGDDTKAIKINFRLYASFELDEDVYFGSYIPFAMSRYSHVIPT